jgi:diamine N-acetyltransferase
MRMAGGSETDPIVNIVGELVALGPARRDLVPLLYRWDNDFALRRTQGGTPVPWTLEGEYAAYDADQDRASNVSFVIYQRAGWWPIGFAAWHDIDYRHGTASYVIGIGEADCRGRGYGTEATRLMLDYAFTALGLHSALCTVYATNPGGQRAYEKAGFRAFGRRRECHSMGGRYWDGIYMECLAREFASPVLGKVFVPDEPRN